MSAVPAVATRLADATAPPEKRGLARDGVRLLVTERATGTHAHHRFFELPSILHAGDLLVVNDSATLPAALTARRASGETLALHVSTMIDGRIFMVEPRSAVLCGEELALPKGGSAVMLAPVDPERPRLWYAWFGLPMPMNAYLLQTGDPIRYGYINERFPLPDYQTMFARDYGSSEMPSAARPFTPRVVHALHERGVELAAITLHCGVASFEAPEQPASERYIVSPQAAAAINAAKDDGRRIIAVGTTVVRALESAFHDRKVIASSGWTDLVIDGKHHVGTVDGLLTGFHHDGATHQWMLHAFVDPVLLSEAYDAAAACGYLQHEFGDVHLIA